MSTDRIISAESGGDPYARNPRSTATGLGQFIESTWLDMMAKHEPDLIAGMDRGQILALRNDPGLSRKMTEAYSNENKAMLGQAGLPVTDGTAYLAHFAGPAGARGILTADPSMSAVQVLDPDGRRGILKANPFLKNMTAGDLTAWANKKMGSPQGSPPAPQMAPQGILAAPAPQNAPTGILGQSGAPVAPAQQPAQGILGGGGMSPEDIAALMAPPKPLQHLQVFPTRPKQAGSAFRGYRA
jgi:hypothetical protein